MTVSSPALPVAPAPDTSSASASPGGCQSTASGEDFASLLSGNGDPKSGSAKSDDSGTSLGQNATNSQNANSDDESSDGVPTPAEQVNLAALLYAPQLTPLPTPVPLGASVCVSNPAQAATAFSLGNQGLPLDQIVPTAGSEATNPVLANVELPTGPVATTGFQVPQQSAPATGATAAPQASTLPAAPQAQAAAPATSTTPAAPAAQSPEVKSPVFEAVAQASNGALPVDPALSASVPAVENSEPRESVETPEIDVTHAEIAPAIPAVNGTTEPPVPASSTKTTSTGNTDGHLVSEQPIAQTTPRGTGSAKAVREMKSPTATTTDSSPESTQRPVTLDKGAQGETSSDQQDSSSAENSATQQTGTETFSVSTAAHAVKSEATSKAAPSAPMTPSAVVKEVNQGLERIQQSGHDRMDLRLSLEGGGEVSIALQVRDGAVHASFQTNSPEMREALQKNWAQMATRSESLAIPLAEPTFKSSTNSSGNFFQQQDPRERRQEASQEQGQGNQPAAFYESGSAQPAKRVSPTVAPVRRASSGLNLYA